MQTQFKPSNWLIFFGVIALAALPLIFVKGEYSGADSQAEEAIAEIRPDYEPWFGSVFEPPSAEIESFLFASQAALGAGLIGYVIGRYQGRSSLKK
ncbi:MAG: energy-coupling factor ABC transporter substrate-binding protein [Cyanobacteriota bacterium]|jgi:cobalt/nickel transport protein